MPVHRITVASLLLTAIILAVFPLTATGAPSLDDVAAAEARANELQDQVAELAIEQATLETRMAVTNDRLVKQRDVVESAEAELASAKQAFRAKLVAIYKAQRPNPLEILLEARTISDLLSRVVLLSRIAESDGDVVREAVTAADEAAYQNALLEDLRAQDIAVRTALDAKRAQLDAALAEQERLVERMTAEALAALQARQAAEAADRARWLDGSIPIGTTIQFAEATVEPYEGTWLVPAYRPKRYRATGEKFNAQCSWYGNEFNGRRTASGQIFNEDDFTCASNHHPFGTVLALSRGGRRIVVVVNDRGPFVRSGGEWVPHPVRKLDLSKASAYALGFTGHADVTIERVVPID